jgi:hypothetical protein
MSNQSDNGSGEMTAELERLHKLVEEQAQRLEAMERGGPRSRRQLLTLAGASVLGAAGLSALTTIPVAANNGDNLVMGTNNTATLTTSVTATVGSLAAFSAANTGTDSSGIRVAGSGDGLDAKLSGTGRLGQAFAAGATGGAGPTFTPSSLGPGGELVRGDLHELWVTRPGGLTGRNAWRKITSVRVDAASNSGGAFTPARIIDTRSITNGGFPLTPGVVYTFGPFPGTNGLPGNATGIVGNFTIAAASGNFGGAGFASIFPGSATFPGTSNINYPAGTPAIANSVVIGFGTGGTAGKLSFFLGGGAPPTHVIVDVFGYLE